jgi:hypothetical protein
VNRRYEIRVRSAAGFAMVYIEEAPTAGAALEQFRQRGPRCAAALKRGAHCVLVLEPTK